MADHFTHILQPASVAVATAWDGASPTFSAGDVPQFLQGDLSKLNEPGLVTETRPLRRMTAEELAEHEREHERTRLREWIASAKRSVDPGAHNLEHEAAVAEHIAGLEAELAAIDA